MPNLVVCASQANGSNLSQMIIARNLRLSVSLLLFLTREIRDCFASVRIRFGFERGRQYRRGGFMRKQVVSSSSSEGSNRATVRRRCILARIRGGGGGF